MRDDATDANDRPDVEIINQGSIVLIQPITAEANGWCDANLRHEETLTWAGAFVCEPRYVQAIIDGMEADGLLVRT